MATKACKLSEWTNWWCIGTLASTYAEAGEYDRAITYGEKTISTPGIDEEIILATKARIELFKQHKPTRESSR